MSPETPTSACLCKEEIYFLFGLSHYIFNCMTCTWAWSVLIQLITCSFSQRLQQKCFPFLSTPIRDPNAFLDSNDEKTRKPGSCVRASSVLAGETALSLCLVRCDVLAGNKVRLWGQEGKELDRKGSASPLKLSVDQAMWGGQGTGLLFDVSLISALFSFTHTI